MNTDRCFKKNHPKWSRLDQEAQENFANAKSSQMPLSRLTIWGCVYNISLEETRHAVVTHQILTENDPQNIVTHRIWQSMIRRTYRHSPYFDQATKVNFPHNQPSLFSNNFLISIFFQIDDFRSDRSFP